MIPHVSIQRYNSRDYIICVSTFRHSYTWGVFLRKRFDWMIPHFVWFTTKGAYALDIGNISIDCELLDRYDKEIEYEES